MTEFPFSTCVTQHTYWKAISDSHSSSGYRCSNFQFKFINSKFRCISVTSLSFISKDSAPSLTFAVTFLQTAITSPFHLHYT